VAIISPTWLVVCPITGQRRKNPAGYPCHWSNSHAKSARLTPARLSAAAAVGTASSSVALGLIAAVKLLA
jgi:hypothetical protein